MASDRKQKSNRIPIRFEGDDPDDSAEDEREIEESVMDPVEEGVVELVEESLPGGAAFEEPRADLGGGGPVLAELIATRSELKRLENALSEAQESVARRQADFENYRKRIEREKGESHRRMVADIAGKLLPVVDNLGRALEAERSLQPNESKEFRHFLHGVELISKQLNELLESFGVQPVAAVGEKFNPHVHEAVAAENSDEHEPDTVIEELTRGYRIGDRLLRPAMVKVATRSEKAGSDEG